MNKLNVNANKEFIRIFVSIRRRFGNPKPPPRPLTQGTPSTVLEAEKLHLINASLSMRERKNPGRYVSLWIVT